ncbi:MAG: type I restriction enzyme HsdR N-terminal domain-containing protein [Candidatus Cryptobacteroides sp.]
MATPKQIWDPLRKKMVALTPEEGVRQWFISLLQSQMKVPVYMMMSEVAMKYGEGVLKKNFRADILVFDRKLKPLMVVECKRPDVELTGNVIEQVLKYNMVLDVKYIVITNGTNSYICRRVGDRFEFIESSPVYEEMLKEK